MSSGRVRYTRSPVVTPDHPFAPKAPLETLLFASAIVGIGTFRCHPRHPLFTNSGPSSTCCFVFPRRSVRIQHEGDAPFVADPGVVTYYNAGQVYTRRAVSPDGDHGEWFALDPVVADEVLTAVSARRGSVSRVFGFTHGPSGPAAYLTQRRLSVRLMRGERVEPLEVEESVLGLLADVAPQATRGAAPSPTRRHRAVVDDARAVLAASPERRIYLHELASAVSCSVYHLCRLFKQVHGTTIHGYQMDLRLRAALEPMSDPRADLTQVALACGFSSHSHFTAAFRRRFGCPPSLALRVGMFSASRRARR